MFLSTNCLLWCPPGIHLGPYGFLALQLFNNLNNVSTVVELILFADDASLLMSQKDPVSWQPHLISKLINYPLGFRQTLLKPVENKLYAI